MALKSTSKKASKPVAAAKSAAPAKTAAKRQPVARVAAPAPKAKPAAPASKTKPVVAATVDDTQKVTFTFFAPEAGSVLVAGDFTKWESSPVSLVKEDAGLWKTTLALKPGKYQYRLLVDGQWQNDPQCPELQPNAFGSVNCVLSVAA
jgi:hypothetical protein